MRCHAESRIGRTPRMGEVEGRSEGSGSLAGAYREIERGEGVKTERGGRKLSKINSFFVRSIQKIVPKGGGALYAYVQKHKHLFYRNSHVYFSVFDPRIFSTSLPYSPLDSTPVTDTTLLDPSPVSLTATTSPHTLTATTSPPTLTATASPPPQARRKAERINQDPWSLV